MEAPLTFVAGTEQILDGAVELIDGTPVVLSSADVLQFKIGRLPGATTLLVSSAAATANGSTLTITSFGAPASGNTPAVPATFEIVIKALDTFSILYGPYNWQLTWLDSTDNNQPTLIDDGIVNINPLLP